MFRVLLATAAFLWTAAAVAQHPPYLHLPQLSLPLDAAIRAANADRGVEGTDQFTNFRYLWLPAEPARQQVFAAALAFLVSSSSRDPNIDAHRPVEVAPGLFRIDLAALQWDVHAYNAISKQDPFRATDFPLVVRADWLMLQLASGVDSQAYYDLLYGAAKPKNRDEFLAFWQVDKKRHEQFRYGLIEEKSGVSVAGIRWIESWPTPDARMWGTRDFFNIQKGQNPLQNPDGDFKHDGEEWIGAAPKFSKTYNTTGHAQVYLLSDQNGKIVQEGPGRLVQDSTRLFGHAVIINPGSCISCHTGGLNYPTSNALRRMLVDGIEVYDSPLHRAQFLERFHLTDTGKFLRRSNEDYAAFIQGVNSLTPEANTAAFQAFVRHYLAPVTLQTAAVELGCDPAELRSAIALASDRGVHVGAHLADLAHGRSMPRREWENQYQAARSYIATWRSAR